MKEYDLFVVYAQQDRAWVEGYLLDALDNANVNYIHEAAFALGAPRLREIEDAITSSERVLLVLSPALSTSEMLQFVEILAQSYGLETGTWPVIPLILEPLNLPPHLAALVSVDAIDEDEWPEAVEAVCRAVQAPRPSRGVHPACPYPGMVPFSEEDSRYFFGRDAEVAALVHRLQYHSLVTIIGPSGSGKSSLAFAGLIPALRKSTLFSHNEWTVRTMRPGANPYRALDTTLIGEVDLEQGQRTSDDGNLLLIVDQFEELFTQESAEREPFITALRGLISLDRCYIAITVRADFFQDLLTSSAWPLIDEHRLEIQPLGADGLRAAIIKPAESVDVFIESALVERLVNTAAGEPGVLPFVQEILRLLWDKLERRYLPLQAYEALVLSVYDDETRTGLQVAMAHVADDIIADLTPEQRTIARRVFIRLVQFGEGRADTRRQQRGDTLQTMDEDPALFEQTLDYLADNRLVTLSSTADGERMADLSHEAMIDGWPKLRTWLDERREAEHVRRRLEDKAGEWTRLGGEDAGLLDEVELAEAERWLAHPDAAELGYSQAVANLIAVSQASIVAAHHEAEEAQQLKLEQAQALAEEQRLRADSEMEATQRVRSRNRWLMALLAAAAVAVVVAMFAAREAKHQQSIAQKEAAGARAGEFLALATARLVDDPEESIIWALKALTTTYSTYGYVTPQAERALHQAIQSSKLRQTYLGHRGAIYDLAIGRNTGIFATGGLDSTTRLWDMSTLNSVRSNNMLPNVAYVSALSLDSSDSQIAVANANGVIQLWDISEIPAELLDSYTPFSDWVYDIAYSPDDNYLAAIGINSLGERVALQIDLTTSNENSLMVDKELLPCGLAYSPNGQLLAIGTENGVVLVQDVTTEKTWKVEHGIEGTQVCALSFRPEHRGQLATAGDDTKVKLWQFETGELIDTFEKHTNTVLQLAFSDDGERLASTGKDMNIHVWSLPSGNLIQTLAGHDDEVRAVEFLPRGNQLISAGADHTARLWQVGSFHQDRVWGLAYSSTGDSLATVSSDGTMRIWGNNGAQMVRIQLDTGDVRDVDYLPNGHTVAAVGENGKVTVVDDESGQILFSTKLDADHLYSVAYSPDGSMLAVGGYKKVFLLDARDGTVKESVSAGNDIHYDLEFHPTNGHLAVAGRDGQVLIFDTKPLAISDTVYHDSKRAIRGVAYSQDGRYLATAGMDGNVVIWETQNYREHLKILGHDANVTGVKFTPDSGYLVTAGADATTKVWEVSNAEPNSILQEPRLTFSHTDPVAGLAMKPDGMAVAIGDTSGEVKLLNLAMDPDELIELAISQITR